MPGFDEAVTTNLENGLNLLIPTKPKNRHTNPRPFESLASNTKYIENCSYIGKIVIGNKVRYIFCRCLNLSQTLTPRKSQTQRNERVGLAAKLIVPTFLATYQ